MVNDENHLKSLRQFRRYGISLEESERRFKAQGCKCAVCGRTETKRWCIDHDRRCCPEPASRYPTCGKCTRGILCFECNIALGHFHDNPFVLNAAIKYVMSFPLVVTKELISQCDLPRRKNLYDKRTKPRK